MDMEISGSNTSDPPPTHLLGVGTSEACYDVL